MMKITLEATDPTDFELRVRKLGRSYYGMLFRNNSDGSDELVLVTKAQRSLQNLLEDLGQIQGMRAC